MKKTTILLVLCFLFLNATAAFADPADQLVVIGDTLIARPLGFATIFIGSAAFIVSFPFALASGSVGQTADVLVGEPFRFTFTRRLGDFRQGGPNSPDSDQ